MSDRLPNSIDDFTFRFFSARQVDEILRTGAKSGREGSSAAISRILKVEPAVQRAELWRRLRQLKFPPRARPFCRSKWTEEDDRILSGGYENGWRTKRDAIRQLLRSHPDWRPYTIWKRAAKLHLVEKQAKRGQERTRLRWNDHDRQVLLNLAGYKTCQTIARILHRSEAAIRCHLIFLGKSSRTHRDGFSRQELATQLHMGRKTIQRLIVEGLLQVRDPRITRDSLDALRNSGRLRALCHHRASAPAANDARTITTDVAGPDGLAGPRNKSRAERVWAEVADSNGLSISAIRRLIFQGVLRIYDPTITEKSLRDFCRQHGALINYEFLSRETQAWLRDSMDLNRAVGNSGTPHFKSLRQHASVVGRCKCGRLVRGNAFFRHLKKCLSNEVPIAVKHTVGPRN